MYYLLLITAVLTLSTVLASPEENECSETNTNGQFSYRCSSDGDNLRFNPISFDIRTPVSTQVFIGMVGLPQGEDERSDRTERANAICVQELGDGQYFEISLSQHFGNKEDFEKWMYENAIDQSQTRFVKFLTHWLKKTCEFQTIAEFMPSYCTFSLINFCSQRHCKDVNQRNWSGRDSDTSCEPFQNEAERDGTFAEIISNDKIVSLCVVDDFYICKRKGSREE